MDKIIKATALKLSFTLILLTWLVATSVVHAQDSTDPAHKWQFEITPYF